MSETNWTQRGRDDFKAWAESREPPNCCDASQQAWDVLESSRVPYADLIPWFNGWGEEEDAWRDELGID